MAAPAARAATGGEATRDRLHPPASPETGRVAENRPGITGKNEEPRDLSLGSSSFPLQPASAPFCATLGDRPCIRASVPRDPDTNPIESAWLIAARSFAEVSHGDTENYSLFSVSPCLCVTPQRRWIRQRLLLIRSERLAHPAASTAGTAAGRMPPPPPGSG